jgi:hypothetical protein
MLRRLQVWLRRINEARQARRDAASFERQVACAKRKQSDLKRLDEEFGKERAEREARPVTNAITVGQVAQRARMLDVRCSRCERAGRLSTARLLLEYGAEVPIWQTWVNLNADCPKRDAQGPGERCSLDAPALSVLFRPP